MTKSKIESKQEFERLHKYIAKCGVCSRRKAEELILEGRVQVNGQIIIELGTKVKPSDKVIVDETLIQTPKLYYVVMNKPKGVLTTMSDPQNRPTIVKYLPAVGAILKPVGRLDKDTEGLLLLTNDGELASRLTHPRYGIEKEYLALVEGNVSEKSLKRLESGITIEGKRTLPARAKIIHYEQKADKTQLDITIHEGRKRQVRLMCDAIGNPVKNLKRIRIGPIVLKGMRSGMCKILGKTEVDKLKKLVKLV